MLIEQSFELELMGTGPPGGRPTCTPTTGYFCDKTKISEKNLRVDYYLLLKFYTRQCILLSLTWAKSLTNVNPKVQGFKQRWSRGHKARGQGQGQGHKKNLRPKPRTAFPRTDTLEAKDRNARGQGQGPRTQAQVLSEKKKVFTKIFQAISKKKRSSQKFFKLSPKKNVFQKNFQALYKILTIQKKRCPRAEDRAIFEDLRPRGQGQGQGLDLRGQGLQNVSSRTSSRTPPLVLSVFCT